MYRLIFTVLLCTMSSVVLAHGEHHYVVGLWHWLVHAFMGADKFIICVILIGSVIWFVVIRSRYRACKIACSTNTR